jgi:hypothetical protein
MSSRIREALADLEHDVATLRLDPPEAVRARGESRRRRQVTGAIATVAVAAVLTGAAALPPLYREWAGSGGQPNQAGAGPTPSDTASVPANIHVPGGCARSTPPTLSGVEREAALAASRKVRVFLLPTTGSAEAAAVEARLRGVKGVSTIGFVDREQQWQRFVAQFCDAPDLVAATKPETLPEAFVVTLVSPGDYSAVKDAVASMPGVSDVVRSLE